MSVRPPEGSSDSTYKMLDLLQRMKTEIIALKRDRDGPDPVDARALRMLETHKSLGNLYGSIRNLQQKLATEATDKELEAVQLQAQEVGRELDKDSPSYVQDVIGQMYVVMGKLAEEKRNDPGKALKTIERTMEIPGARVGPMMAGGAIGTAAATSLGASTAMTTTAMVGGTVLGAVAAPIAIEALANKVENPAARSILKTAMYAGVAGAAALLAPQALIPLAVSFGISGLIHLIHSLSTGGAPATAPAPATAAEPARGRARVAPQPT